MTTGNGIAPLDAAFVGILAVSLLLGMLRGLAYEAVALLASLVAVAVAQELAPDLAQAFAPAVPDAPWQIHFGVAFALLFLGLVFAGGVPAWLAHKLVESLGLRWVDRMLGSLFGLVRGVLLLLAVAVVVNLTPLRAQPWWTAAAGSALTAAALQRLKPVLPEELAQYLP